MGGVWLLLGHVRQQRHYPRSAAGREQPPAGAIALSEKAVVLGCLGHTAACTLSLGIPTPGIPLPVQLYCS